MKNLAAYKRSFLVSVWFMFLTFPVMVIRVNTIEKAVQWRWMNMVWVGAASFLLSLAWHFLNERRETARKVGNAGAERTSPLGAILAGNHEYLRYAGGGLLLFALAFPFLVSTYQTNIMTTALMYVVLGLGLNIVVGLAGLLNLGYAAFYAAGAYA